MPVTKTVPDRRLGRVKALLALGSRLADRPLARIDSGLRSVEVDRHLCQMPTGPYWHPGRWAASTPYTRWRTLLGGSRPPLPSMKEDIGCEKESDACLQSQFSYTSFAY